MFIDVMYLFKELVDEFNGIGNNPRKRQTKITQQILTQQIPVDIYKCALMRNLTIIPSLEYELGKIENSTIFINPNLSLNRTRFMIAHCIGHHIRGTVDGSIETLANFSDSVSGVEHDANVEAVNLLIPPNALLHELQQGTPFNNLARKFQVSPVALSSQLSKL